MITVYGKTGCPYTSKVIAVLDAHGLSFTKKNIANKAILDELMEKGGKHQVPFLVDADTALYESDVIIEYIEKTYGAGKGKSDVHVAEVTNTCSLL
jgi:glutathione S-transferase